MTARREYKHSLNFGDYIVLRNRLRHTMKRDPHTGLNGEYRVRSLYFDTPGDKALREKIDGVDNRDKFRIRRYLNSEDYIVLEKKSKRHGLCYKQSARVTVDEVRALLNGETKWLLDKNLPIAKELYTRIQSECLSPKTVVDYIREPFIYAAGNVRVTFDRDIHTGVFSTDFLNDEMPAVPAGDEIVLLEVKYDQFIPSHLVNLLRLGDRRASACSKYALCRIYG
ncbi:MAG: polyphosphate polymerase domain-containing protein [Clostridiales bacterium]|nr:polyphosphate polymerase domain-containing protein [Clostridiales bacterium]